MLGISEDILRYIKIEQLLSHTVFRKDDNLTFMWSTLRVIALSTVNLGPHGLDPKVLLAFHSDGQKFVSRLLDGLNLTIGGPPIKSTLTCLLFIIRIVSLSRFLTFPDNGPSPLGACN